MGKIKSAWEIALEKTENIVVDENKIRHQETINQIRKIAGSYLMADSDESEKVKNDLKGFKKEDLSEALSMTILNGLALPSEEIEDDRYTRLKTLLEIVSQDDQAFALFDQITSFLKQYPVHKKQLLDQMKQQFEPMLKEKEAQMKEQYGQDVHLSLETDKEFLQVAKQNIEKLEAQYEHTLDGAKNQLKAFLQE